MCFCLEVLAKGWSRAIPGRGVHWFCICLQRQCKDSSLHSFHVLFAHYLHKGTAQYKVCHTCQAHSREGKRSGHSSSPSFPT